MKNLWMSPDLPWAPPRIVVYRNRFKVEREQELVFDFSADECCRLFLNGERVADGPNAEMPGTGIFPVSGLLLPPATIA